MHRCSMCNGKQPPQESGKRSAVVNAARRNKKSKLYFVCSRFRRQFPSGEAGTRRGRERDIYELVS